MTGDATLAACTKHANKYAYYPVTVGHPRLSFSSVFFVADDSIEFIQNTREMLCCTPACILGFYMSITSF